MEEKLDNGRKVRILNIIDEFTRECLATESGFNLKAHDVTDILRYLFQVRGCPTYIRSDNGAEFLLQQSYTWKILRVSENGSLIGDQYGYNGRISFQVY